MKDINLDGALHIIPVVSAASWRAIAIYKSDVKVGNWTHCDSHREAREDLIKYLSSGGESVLTLLTESANLIKELKDEIGESLPPVKLSDLMKGLGRYKDTKFESYVKGWVEDYLPDAELDRRRPEPDLEHWEVIPLERYAIEEVEATDEEGDIDNYWLIFDENPVNPSKEVERYADCDWKRRPRDNSYEVTYKGKTEWGYILKSDAKEMADYLNAIATGGEEYPEVSEMKYVNSAIPIKLLQENGLTVYKYSGDETSGTIWNLVDFSGFQKVYREDILATICAKYHHMKGYAVTTSLGMRHIDPFN